MASAVIPDGDADKVLVAINAELSKEPPRETSAFNSMLMQNNVSAFEGSGTFVFPTPQDPRGIFADGLWSSDPNSAFLKYCTQPGSNEMQLF
jgi:hypothetical protein